MKTNAALLDSPGLYLTGEDNLRLTTFGGVANAVLAIEGRLVDTSGQIIPIAETQSPNSNYTAKQSTINLAEGLLTHIHIRATSAGLLGGGCWAILEIIRGTGTTAQALGTILQGYVTTNGRLAWPGSPIQASTAGVGRMRSIVGTDPAAGVEIIETVPAGARWRPYALTATLVNSAVVANREPVLVFDDGVNVFARVPVGFSSPASATPLSSWMRQAIRGTAAISGPQIAPMPDLMLPAGARMRTITTNLDVGDNWSAPTYLVEEFIE